MGLVHKWNLSGLIHTPEVSHLDGQYHGSDVSEGEATVAQVHPFYVPQPYQDSAEAGRLILRDGSTAAIRIAQPADQEELRAFFDRLSPESRHKRFFSLVTPRGEWLSTLCDASDLRQQLTVIVTRLVEGHPRIIATGSYLAERDKEDMAEVALAVEDPLHGQGLGSLILERLAVLAVHHGIRHFWAVTHLDNRLMLEVFRRSGFAMQERRDRGDVRLDFAVIPTEASVARSELLDRLFTTASMQPLFRPTSVAVVGASRDPTSIGSRILEGLIMHRFQGSVYPINPRATVVGSLRAYASVRDLPEPVDLAVIAVPRDAVLPVVDACAERGVKALVVITAGFAESDAAGRAVQHTLVEKVRGYGMRMVGPNCLGLLNTDPHVQLNASFSPIFPPPGRVAMSSQSGALGIAILGLARQLHLGLSMFVSVGNKADVSGNDLLQFWEDDASTDVILLYLESFGNPRRFARLARRVSRRKPVVMKSGRTTAGSRAAGSHTAALAASDVAVEALFHQTGVIRADTLADMFDLAAVLGSQPLPQGRRVAIVTNAGGPGILCADTCEAGGLLVPDLSAATKARLAAFLPAEASLGNPVDMIASAGPDAYRRTIEALLSAEDIDALLVIYIPVDASLQAPTLEAISAGVVAGRAAGGGAKPVLLTLMVEDGAAQPLFAGPEQVPSYPFPEASARVLGKVAAYAAWRRQPLGMLLEYDDARPQAARAICHQALAARGAGWLSTDETRQLLLAMGLPVAPGGVAHTAEEALQLAQEVGFPVALKLASHVIVHKTEMGGIALNVRDGDQVRQTFESLQERLARAGQLEVFEGALVQPMVAGGVEVMVGVTTDPLFGPLIAFGLGGVHVEILGDVCFRITPLTDRDASEMVRAIRGYRLLEGYRGHAPADVPALEEVLLRISSLVDQIPEITELDLNPIFALPPGQGCHIVDARIRVERAQSSAGGALIGHTAPQSP
jgi:acetyl coenzyme A synthetase (ADP forming)-like protein